MEMETEDDVDGNADPPSSAAPFIAEFKLEIAEIAPVGKEGFVAT